MPGKLARFGSDPSYSGRNESLERDIEDRYDEHTWYVEYLERLCETCYTMKGDCDTECNMLLDRCESCGRKHSGASHCSYCLAWADAIEELYYHISYGRPGFGWPFEAIASQIVRATSIESLGHGH